MTRPAFLSRPGVWTRTARTAQSPTDYACAVQHNVKPRSWHPAEWVFIAAFVGFMAALIFWS
jgi:uncharacterized protein (DUF1800 family)